MHNRMTYRRCETKQILQYKMKYQKNRVVAQLMSSAKPYEVDDFRSNNTTSLPHLVIEAFLLDVVLVPTNGESFLAYIYRNV